MSELPGVGGRHLLCLRGLWKDDVRACDCSQTASHRYAQCHVLRRARIAHVDHSVHACIILCMHHGCVANRNEEGSEDVQCVLWVWAAAVQAVQGQRLRGAVVTHTTCDDNTT